MNDVINFITEQLDKFLDYENSKPKSVVIFGIQKHEISELYHSVYLHFDKIKTQLLEKRKIEKSIIFQKECKSDIEKYDELVGRYIDTDKFGYVLELQNQSYEINQNYVDQYHTELKEITDKLNLVNFDIYEYHNKIKRKNILDDTLNFSRLLEYKETKDKYLFNKLSDEEKEYIELHEYNIEHSYPKYVFIHNFYESEKTEWKLIELMRGIFKRDRLKWSIICIEPNNEFWEKNKSDDLKFEVYYNRKVFDLAEKITPIENRLKTELENAGISYVFQYPIGKYILDFFIQQGNIKLNVECDGQEFHSSFEAKEYDNERDKFMKSKGFKVIRFPGIIVWNNPKFCVEKIIKILNDKYA